MVPFFFVSLSHPFSLSHFVRTAVYSSLKREEEACSEKKQQSLKNHGLEIPCDASIAELATVLHSVLLFHLFSDLRPIQLDQCSVAGAGWKLDFWGRRFAV